MVNSAPGKRKLYMESASYEREPLHNFIFPSSLKWGIRKHLGSFKIDNGSSNYNSDHLPVSVPSETSRSRECDDRKFKKPKLGTDLIEETNADQRVAHNIRDFFTRAIEKLDAMAEPIPFDDSISAASLKWESLKSPEDDGEEISMAAPVKVDSMVAPVSTNNGEKELDAKVAALASISNVGSGRWNLRSRRTACDRKDGGEEKKRKKFSLALSKKEIEEDFLALVGQKPAQRPTKRPKQDQEVLDKLFPGLDLSEVTIKSYKVPAGWQVP